MTEKLKTPSQNNNEEQLIQEDEHQLKKYETLYEHSQNAIEESISQFDKAYQKAGYHLTIVGIMFIALGILFSAIVKMIVAADGVLEIIIFSLPVLTATTVLTSAFFLLNCLRVVEISKPRSDEQLFDWVDENSYIDTIGFLTEHNMKATSDNDNIFQTRATNIKIASVFIKISIVCLVITFLLTTISIVQDQEKQNNNKPQIIKNIAKDKMGSKKPKPKRNQIGPVPKKTIKESNPGVLKKQINPGKKVK